MGSEMCIRDRYYTEKPIHARAMGCLPLINSDPYMSIDFNMDGFINFYNYSSEIEFVEYVRFLLMRPDIIKRKIDQDIFTRKPSLDGVRAFLLSKYNQFNSN